MVDHLAFERLTKAHDELEAAERRHAHAVVAEEENHRRVNDYNLSEEERRRAWRESGAIVAELEVAEEELERAKIEFSRAGMRIAMLSLAEDARRLRCRA
jgi:hypothetical protein